MEEINNVPPGVLKSLLMNVFNGTDSKSKEIYLQIYNASLAEASMLLKEAELLFDNRSFQRAYFLSVAALEEISKSQLAADVFTGLIDEDKFKQAYRNHKEKISRIEWIRLDGNSYPYFAYDQVLIPDFDFQKKLKSMYVDVDFGSNEVSTPSDSITEKDAESMLKAVKVGLHRIYEVTIENGEQIGTKGFMK